ncbi:MAG: plasmid pRiA4b ORF-3 family protein, partial [Spirochaetales bacterium]
RLCQRTKKTKKPISTTQTPTNRQKSSKEQYYVFKIQLQYIRPPIWRRIQIPGSYDLQDLHLAIQNCMGWGNYHAYEFLIDNRYYGPRELEDDSIIPDTSVTLKKLELQPRKRFLYTYDFGDNWGHTIILEKIQNEEEIPQDQRGKPFCLGGKRACPPEDCGGFPGYEYLIEALNAPNKKKYREVLNWVGKYDPDQFDLEEVNKALRKTFGLEKE